MAKERVQNLLPQVTKSRKCCRIPIFVYPSKLKFYIEDKTSHRQKLNIYNPYDIPVLFGIFATPEMKDQFYVDRGESVLIAPHNYAEVFFTHLEPTESNLKISTTFLILISDYETKTVIGKRCIVGTLLSVLEKDDEEESVFATNNSEDTLIEEITQRKNSERYFSLSLRFLVFLGVVLLAMLLLPREEDWKSDTLLPKYLFVSGPYKTTLAFFFGVVVILAWQQINANFV